MKKYQIIYADPPKQAKLPTVDEYFLGVRIAESQDIIRKIATQTDKPLIIQFSGGRDSVAMVGLTREVTSNFVCSFMETGIEFPEAIEFARESAKNLGVDLLISTPDEHKGGFFQRLAQFQKWPTVRATWCSRDLKIRPQQKMLHRIFGKGGIIKLIGVRRFESIRRTAIYGQGEFIRPDNQVAGAGNVYPILHWTDDDVVNYLEKEGLPTSGLYKRYGVSGCYWCPFYQVEIYTRILADQPTLYDEFIEWENKLRQPSVIGNVYLETLK